MMPANRLLRFSLLAAAFQATLLFVGQPATAGSFRASDPSCPVARNGWPADHGVRLTIDRDPLSIRNDLGGAELTALYHEVNGRTASQNPDIAGAPQGGIAALMDGRLSFASQHQLEWSPVAPGWVCPAAAGSLIHIRYRPIIYIARDRVPGTCRYRAALAHERRHLEADLAALSGLEAALEHGLREVAQRFAERSGHTALAVAAPHAPSFEVSFFEALESGLAAIMAGWQRNRQSDQRAIDSPAEYARIAAACPPE